MARILLLGCGQLASQLHMFTDHDLVGVRRTPMPEHPFPVHACDLTDLQATRTLLEELGTIDLVVFSATPSQREVTAYRSTYVQIPMKVMSLFEELDLKPHWLHVSSTGVFHHTSGEWVHEDTQPAPRTPFAQLLRESEKRVDAYGSGTILRFGGLYGQGRTHLLNSLRAGRHIQCWPWSYTNRIHREDAVRAIAFLLEKALAAPSHGVDYFHGVDHDPAPLHEVAQYLATKHGLIQPNYYEIQNEQAYSSQNKRVGNGKLVRAGFQFKFPTFRQGL